jgi:O-antigen ligase
MTRPPRPTLFAGWCGWVAAAVFALTPLVAWLGPLAFAPLCGLAGLVLLPALKIEDQDRPAAIGLVVMLIWAVGSVVWSPYVPKDLEGSTAVKLVAQAVLYAAFVAGARLASPFTRWRALRVLAWGAALLGVILTVEALTGAIAYRTLRDLMGDPIRPDLAAKNVAQGGFVLTLLTPAAALAALRTGRGPWLAVPMVAGIAAIGVAFGYDALLIALAAAVVAGLAVLAWPRGGPRGLAVFAAAFFLGAPALVWFVRANGWYAPLQASVPLSWSMRMGYWASAADWIADHPLRGWGLDASRMFAPGIQLHPHDAALQIWLELGLIGAMGAAVFYAAMLAGLARPTRDAGRAVAAATAMAYLTFSAFSFGVWQEWWLALGALSASACLLVARQPAAARASSHRPAAARPSTPPVFSE